MSQSIREFTQDGSVVSHEHGLVTFGLRGSTDAEAAAGDPRPDTTEEPPAIPPDADDAAHGSLRGTMVAVIVMASFFVVTWFGMLLLAMERR